MPPIKATVSLSAGQTQPKVVPDPIVVPEGNGATVIQWSCGENVIKLQITGLDATVFSPDSSNGMVTSFSTTDANRTPGTYNYNVAVTRATGATAGDDPKIQNGG
jgi:hypothetical protein